MTTDSSEQPFPSLPESIISNSRNGEDLSSEPPKNFSSDINNNQKYYNHILEERQVGLDHKKRLMRTTEIIVGAFYVSLLYFIYLLADGRIKLDLKIVLAIILVLASIPTALMIGMMRSQYKLDESLISQKNSEEGPSIPLGPFITAISEYVKHMR